MFSIDSVHPPFEDEEQGMIDFRYVMRTMKHDGRTYTTPVLQYRHCVAVDASGAFCPGEWSRWIDIQIETMGRVSESR